MTETKTEVLPARARYAHVLDQCRDMVLIFSNSQLTELLEHAGAALLDFAERAENNSIQGRFFEAMGLIQRRRPDIERSFRHEIAEAFDRFGNLSPPSQEVDVDGTTDVGVALSLVEPDEMEESVASENLIIRANADCFPELYALSQRLSVINDGNKLKDYEIPAGPNHLVRAFRHSIAGLDVEVRLKIILYALFDKFVIKRAKTLYDELNGSLKAAGILPNLKPVHVRAGNKESHVGQTSTTDRRTSSQTSSETIQEGQETVSLGAELFDSILDLMSTRHRGRQDARRRSLGAGVPASPEAAAAESRQLFSAIDKLQSQTRLDEVSVLAGGPGHIPNLEVDARFIEKVKKTLGQERDEVLSHVDRDKLPPMDADLIDLIGMLFEYMLNDPVLPNMAKALLSHLHTPYLKVALIDRRLLVDARHPARRLLDQMVDAGSLWVDESNPNRGVFPAMQQVVDRVLQEFKDDVSLFEKLLSFFEQAMNDQRRKTDTMEQRTQDAARGREKLQLAKHRANHEIQLLVKDRQLPQELATFLSRTWLDQLVFILLRDEHEDHGDAWKQAVQTGKDLAALFDPRIPTTELRARRDTIPQLRTSISQAIQRMGSYSRGALDGLFALLDKPETWEAKRPDDAIGRPVEARAQTEEAMQPVAPLAEAGPIAEGEATEQELEVIKRLRKMKFDTWFAFTSETGAAPRRIKLSWLSPLTATCMFVDRSGMQAEIKTLHEFAQDILSGRAKMIPRPKHPFIERALVSIRKMLQSDKEEPSTEAR